VNGVDGIGRPRALDFDRPGAETRDVSYGELDHAQSMVCWGQCDGLGIFVGWQGGGDEAHLVQASGLADLFGGTEVPEVDRVEAASENGDGA
jgi:hypothetical protein